MIDCLIMPSQERNTNLENRLEEIRRRELKEKGVKPKETVLDSSKKTPIKEVKLGVIELTQEKISNIGKEIKNLADLKNKISKTATTEVVEIMFGGAISVEASDIHFEPEEKNIGLRLRIDGVLQNVFDLEKKAYPAILNRIKLMAGLKINIHDAPQDGRLTLKTAIPQPRRTSGAEPLRSSRKIDIEVRVSILPGASGESIVMRLLDPRTLKKDLEELGIKLELLEEIKKQLK